ncbi:MAG: VWA domain-containing protein [Candidatus Coproplasma sp.]
MSSINFDNPWLLFVALPIIILVTVPFALAIRKDNLNGHNIASGIIHIVMAVIIAFAAAGASVITTVTQTDVYVLADVSYSASLNLDTVDNYINQLSTNLPANSRMGVVCFANGQKLVTRLGERFDTVKDSGVDATSTNIVDALSYTGSLFRDDVIKRIVLITDGKATDGTDDDALRRQISSLAERNIHVDAIFVDNNMKGDVTEVQMSGTEFTSSVSLNRDERVSLNVQVNCPEGETVDAIITLYKDGEIYKQTAHTLVKGENSVSFALDTSTAGAHDYTASIECEGDFNLNNNEISFTQSVSGKTNILLLANDDSGAAYPADVARIQELYADQIAAGNAELTSYVNMTEIPITVEELSKYDEIILSDFDVSGVENSELFLNNLDTVVSLYGKSLITFGDTYIQGRTDSALDSLSDMLPVIYGKTADAPKLYTLLIDTSRSMEQLNKLENAKTAAKQIVNMLSSGDRLNIIEFNGDASPVLTNYDISNGRDEPIRKIEELDVVQGTVMSAGLDLAYSQMKEGIYSEKRLILISDGLDMGGTDVRSKIREMRAESIHTIVLDAGRGASTDANASAAKQLLIDIAQIGNNGEPFDISSTDNLKDVIENELAQDVNNFVGDPSFIFINRRRDEVLSGIAEEELTGSYVMGFIKSKAKPNANTVLNVSYEYLLPGWDESDSMSSDVPLYAYWKYGNGRVASFTASLTGSWIDSVPDNVSTALFKNVLDTAVPTEKTDYPFLFDIEKGAGSATVSITPSNIRSDGWAKYKITAPDGSVTQGDMSFGSLSYGYNFVTPSEGKYTVEVTYGYSDLYSVTATKYFNVSYSAEYDSFAIYDASSLIKGIGANGKVSTDGNLKIENDDKEVGRYNLSLIMPLLIACVVLYAVDIAVRKLKWEDIKSLFGRGKK